MSFVFCGAGSRLPWVMGIARYLVDKRFIEVETTPCIMGVSAGALTAAVTLSGVDTDLAVASATRIMEKRGVFTRWLGFIGIMSGILREWLEEVLPPDAHERCSGRLYVFIQRLFRGNMHVSQFPTREFLISALLASSHLPFVMNGLPFRWFNGSIVCDGGVLFGNRGEEMMLPNQEGGRYVEVNILDDPSMQVHSTWNLVAILNGVKRIEDVHLLLHEGYSFGPTLVSKYGLLLQSGDVGQDPSASARATTTDYEISHCPK